MPTRITRVRWSCPQCGKSRWYRPCDIASRKFCSRACQYLAARVAHPVREKPGQKLARYGEKTCGVCQQVYEAKSPTQRFCSQSCMLVHLHDRRRGDPVEPRPCEYCGKVFTPRKGSAGRFCSRVCNLKGAVGERASGWKGGRHIGKDGYVRVYTTDHPRRDGFGYVQEHIIVMEKKLGRLLEPNETVHHIDLNRSNNVEMNLQLRKGRHGKGAAYSCGDCGSINIISVPLLPEDLEVPDPAPQP